MYSNDVIVRIVTVAPKSKQSDNDSTTPIDPLNQPENDKAFYENLPFHGMQNPPNKVRIFCLFMFDIVYISSKCAV